MTHVAQMTKHMKGSQGDFKPQLCNTEMCKFYRAGECTRGSSCTFAHNIQSLRKKPNLFQTQLCKAFMKTGVCIKGGFCNFAHGKDEQQKREHKPIHANKMLMPNIRAIKTQGHETPKSSGTVIPAPPTQQLKCQPLCEVHYTDTAPLVPCASLSSNHWQKLMTNNNHKKSVDMEESFDASKSTDDSDTTMPCSKQPSEFSRTPVSQLASCPLQDTHSLEDFGVSIKNTFIDDFIEGNANASEQHLRRCTSAPSIC